MFALKFSHDARVIKDKIVEGLSEQKNINTQWISLFKKLPIGILITDGSQVLHTNRKMQDITGIHNIKVLVHFNHK
jgi:hypothetical protein